jgi:hypothetical protein
LKYFPSKYNNHIDLAKSKLIDSKSYGKPDSVVYLDKLPTEFRNKQGDIYFFKYKEKKNDISWKLATSGLISNDPGKFEIKDESVLLNDIVPSNINWSYRNRYDFTSFTNSKLKDDEPIAQQLSKELKKMLYSRRQSAKEFYNESKSDFDEISMRVRD